MTNDNLDPITGRKVPGDVSDDTLTSGAGSTRNYPDLGSDDPTVADPALGLDDLDPVPATSGQTGTGTSFTADDSTVGSYSAGESYSTGAPYGTGGTGSGTGDKAKEAAGKAKDVAGHAADQAAAVKDTAVEKAGEVKDVAVERGSDVAGVAKDELARLAGDARTQLQGLWQQASSQLREQAGAGQHQLADLLHSLSSELGEMASKSEQDGPLTAFARQASYRGGELSHWLANAEASDVLTEVKRFARRRPFAFLAGAAVAGVVVGRLSRGLMAANEHATDAPGSSAVGSTYGSSEVGSTYGSSSVGSTYGAGGVGSTHGSPTAAPVVAEDLPAYGGGTTGQTYGYTPTGESR